MQGVSWWQCCLVMDEPETRSASRERPLALLWASLKAGKELAVPEPLHQGRLLRGGSCDVVAQWPRGRGGAQGAGGIITLTLTTWRFVLQMKTRTE